MHKTDRLDKLGHNIYTINLKQKDMKIHALQQMKTQQHYFTREKSKRATT
jgi:hypothetical protein